MHLYFALVSGFFFASTVLAHRLRGHRQSQLLKRDAPFYNIRWAGAVSQQGSGTFTSITGTFTATTPSGQAGAAASVWVGLDGNTCDSDGLLQTGVDMSVTGDGVSYGAWAEWYPGDSYYFPNFPISPGDAIRANVTAFSSTTGIAFIENLTTGQSVSKQLSSTSVLCGQTAEWIVEAFNDGSGNQVSFANFGTVTFTDAVATGSGTYTPDGAAIYGIEQGNQVLTSASADGSSLTVTYV